MAKKRSGTKSKPRGKLDKRALSVRPGRLKPSRAEARQNRPRVAARGSQ